MKKQLLLSSIFSLMVLGLFAQGREGKLPLLSNPVLQNLPTTNTNQSHFKNTFSKTAAIYKSLYPFVDYFNHTGNGPSDSLWMPSNTRVINQQVVFNSLDSNNATYSASTQIADVLQSQNFAFFPQTNAVYVKFTYSMGSTWNVGDSLVLSLKTSGGTYLPVWTSIQNPVKVLEVLIPISFLYNYTGTDFNFNFTCYTNNSSSNTETFQLHSFVLSEKISLPYYENFFLFDSAHFLPHANLWEKRTTKVSEGIQTGKGFSNFVIFDAFDERGNVYRNGNGQAGYTDTLMSHHIDLLTQFDPYDLVYLRFFAKGMPNATSSDSLILECKSNGGIWSKLWGISGTSQTNFSYVFQSINAGKLRGPDFQYRIISKCHYSTLDTLKFIVAGLYIGRQIELPFVDDFSDVSLYPNPRKWTDKAVFINPDFAIRPPSINVATFDALDAKGNAYKNGAHYADTLTSVPINLSGLTNSDTNVYMSFWIEPKGFGELPNKPDSLVLEARHSATQTESYNVIWMGARTDYPTDTFTQIIVRIDSTYFHDDMQFRFKNVYGNYGNLDHWNLDYIRLNKENYNQIKYYDDIALSSTTGSGSLLTPYTSMPYDHFSVSPTTYIKTTQKIVASNNSSAPKPMQYSRTIKDPTGTTIDSIGTATGAIVNIGEFAFNTPNTPLGWTPTSDSTVFTTTYKTANFGTGDNNILTNDTQTVPTIFSNYYAYDDGTAENGYAIMNVTGKVALRYDLAKADNLMGVSMYFNQSAVDVSAKSFDLVVWTNINTSGNGTGQDELARVSLIPVTYTNKRNGFYYYQFEHPIPLAAGKFYIGWQQYQIFPLNIGCDENFQINGNNVNPNLNYFLDDVGLWKQTESTGALMFRPIIGKWIDPPLGVQTLIKEVEDFVQVYPNPTSDYLMVTTSKNEVLDVTIFDLAGREVMHQIKVNGRIELPSQLSGIYFVKATNKEGQSSVKKIVVQE